MAQRWRLASAGLPIGGFSPLRSYAGGSCALAEPAEHALRPQEDDQQKDDEDRRVLQLVGQYQGRHLLHDADYQPAPERADIAADPPEHDPGIHDDDEIEPDIGLKGLKRRDETAGDRRDSDPETPGDEIGRASCRERG